ncbi:MAG: cupin domain-containing protein [Candidatus Micrarchaeota archaeon]|nr:cupin domain-containing protein [Candidatus Micrarchaeota archaeon]
MSECMSFNRRSPQVFNLRWFRRKLKKSSEVYYILQGKGIMFINDETKEVRAGDAIYIPPDAVQRIKNTGDEDLIFLAIVDPAWQKEDEDVLESG